MWPATATLARKDASFAIPTILPPTVVSPAWISRRWLRQTRFIPLPFGRGQRFQIDNPAANLVFGGWQLNAIATLTSGNPFTVSYSGDVANTGNVNQGVDQIGSPYLAKPTIYEWFNTAAYQTPAQYTYGDVGRNTLRSDWYRDFDLAVSRTFTMERARAVFRAEAFNFTNTAVWGTPGATLNSTTFGKVSGTASTQRELQMALKLYF